MLNLVSNTKRSISNRVNAQLNGYCNLEFKEAKVKYYLQIIACFPKSMKGKIEITASF